MNDYVKDGFIGGIRVIPSEDAGYHRAELEKAEAELGRLHYVQKIHTMLRFTYELATHPRLVNVVEAILGADILLYNTNYIIKEPNSPNFVSWHQDLTYWGFDNEDLVSAWVAITPATNESGCMQMIAGSHKWGMRTHSLTDNDYNVLHLGQTIKDVKENSAAICPLSPGEASLHHGWTIHSSEPNSSSDRRIGLNIQYVKPSMKQHAVKNDSAMLIRGEDHYGYFESDPQPPDKFPMDAKERMAELTDRYEQITNDESQR